MAEMSQASRRLKQLEAENLKLRDENKHLQKIRSKSATSRVREGRWLKQVGAILLLCLAVALLIVGNLLFWTGNTVVKSDRFAAATAPIIKDKEIQQAIARYTTTQLYANVNVEDVVSGALPPRADFLAPTIASQLESHTDEALQKVLARPQFQTRWSNIQLKAHDRFITAIEKNGSDGAIDLNEVYKQLSGELKNTKLAFLADKPLPASVGSIEIVSGSGLSALHRVITHIDLWRTVALLLFASSAVAGIMLSRHRRRAVINLGVVTAVFLFATLVSLRIVREIIAGKVQPEYAEAVRHTAQIVFHPLAVQTTTLLVTFLLIAFIAWISGPTRTATLVKARLSDLLAGKLHSGIFGDRENAFTLWLGRYKRIVQWATVAAIAIICLLVRLTPGTLLACALTLLLLVLVVETLAAPAPISQDRAL